MGASARQQVRNFLDGPDLQSSRRLEAARWLAGNFFGSEDDRHGHVPMRIVKEYVRLRAGADLVKAARQYLHRKKLRCVYFGDRIPRCSRFLAPLTEDAVAFEDHSEFYCCDACGFQACLRCITKFGAHPSGGILLTQVLSPPVPQVLASLRVQLLLTASRNPERSRLSRRDYHSRRSGLNPWDRMWILMEPHAHSLRRTIPRVSPEGKSDNMPLVMVR